MPDPANHPPKPALCYRLGVAGTRDLNAPPPLLQQRVGELLDLVKDRTYAIWRECPQYFSAGHPRLMLLCSLAKGVDLLVAQLACERGWELHVPLAYDRQTYAHKNFGTHDAGERAAFHAMLERATAVLELDGEAEAKEDNAYDVAGSVLVTHSDALLAIWDFGSGKGKGGTADSVGKAELAGLPVIRMKPDDPGNDPSFGDLKRIVRGQLLLGIESRGDFPETPTIRRERKRLLTYYNEVDRRVDWGFAYRWANVAIALKRRKHMKMLPFREAANHNWCRTKDESFRDVARAYFKPFDQWADGLAVFYANWTRSVVVVTLFVGALLLIYALSLKLWPDLGRNYGLAIPDGLFAILLTGLVVHARMAKAREKWLAYRMLSEFLRNSSLASAIGGLQPPHSRFHEPSKVAETWVFFYLQSVVRAMGLPSVRFDAAYLADFRAMLAARIGSQIRFHNDRRIWYGKIEWRIRRIGFCIFLISLTGAVLQVATVLIPNLAKYLPWDNLPENLSRVSLVLPVFGAALVAYGAQESFGRLARLSGAIVRRLENISNKLDQAPLPMRSATMRDATSEAIDEMMREHEEWFVLYSMREIGFPGA